MNEFDNIYKNIVSDIYNNGVEEYNERTGLKTKIKTGIHFDLRVENFPLLTLRKIPLKLFIAEQIWYLRGEKKLDFFQKYSKIWDNFMEENNTVESSYGYRWRKYFKKDQVKGLINMLQKEPSSRQGIVVTWDQKTDGLDNPKKKNSPCVPMWIANIVNGELNLHIIFRSNDVMLGLPHDVAGFALLQHILAQKLGIKVGCLHYSISHAHIYENHYEQASELIKRTNKHNNIKLTLPNMVYDNIFESSTEIVENIFKNLKNQYNPLESLGKMQIAL